MSIPRLLPTRLHPLVRKRPVRLPGSCRYHSNDVVHENDVVILKNSIAAGPILTPRLVPGRRVDIHRDYIEHTAIIGKKYGLGYAVAGKSRNRWRVHRPTLGEYTDNSRRIVTPIYSQDANLIVSLLDLHPTVPGSGDETKLEIFEAGTGHGALTLHLARAIHAANTAPPSIPASDTVVEELSPEQQEEELAQRQAYESWKTSRRAVVHSLDISKTHSAHAENVVREFHRGIYYSDVDFHVGTIKDYLSARILETDNKPFIDHAILDLPATHEHMGIVGKALKDNGLLLTFCPSITQITASLFYTKDNQIPLFLERVLEVGGAIGVGGREWDVRPVKPRSVVKEEFERSLQQRADGESVEAPQPGSSTTTINEYDGWEMVCRPKVGLKIVGGGFIGVWRKMVPSTS